jgi:hypothetical protein
LFECLRVSADLVLGQPDLGRERRSRAVGLVVAKQGDDQARIVDPLEAARGKIQQAHHQGGVAFVGVGLSMTVGVSVVPFKEVAALSRSSSGWIGSAPAM